MSKLYATITESARKTKPTARGHSVVAVNCKNWEYAVNTSITAKGGGGADHVSISITNINTLKTLMVWSGTLSDLEDLAGILNPRG